MAQLMDRILHVRFDGRSAELPLSALNLASDAEDAQIKQAVARHFGLPHTYLDDYVIVRNITSIIIRPEAIYG